MAELAIRLVASLAVIVGLLLLLVRFGGRRFRGSGDSMVRVVHRQALGRSSAVSVVEVAGRLLVLGTTEQQVSVLAELEADADPSAAAQDATGTAPAVLTAPAVPAAVPAPDAVVAAPPAPADPAPADPAPLDLTHLVAAPSPGRHRADAAPLPGRHAARVPSEAAPAHPAADVPEVLPPSLAALAMAELAERNAPGRHAAVRPVAAVPPVAAVAPVPPVAAVPPVPAVPSPVAPAAGDDATMSASMAQLLAMLPETGGAPRVAAASETVTEADHGADPEATPATGRAARRARRAAGRRSPSAADGPLAGSVLSLQTWRAAVGAVNRRAS